MRMFRTEADSRKATFFPIIVEQHAMAVRNPPQRSPTNSRRYAILARFVHVMVKGRTPTEANLLRSSRKLQLRRNQNQMSCFYSSHYSERNSESR